MNTLIRIFPIAGLSLILACSCKKSSAPSGPASPPGNTTAVLYGDSIYYLRPQAGDLIVSPLHPSAGQYIGFPDGIQIDGNTGEINVSKSETGLRYRVSFIPKGSSDTVSQIVIISGVNFLDGFYNLAQGDSIANPIYNGWTSNAIPGLNNGSAFDEGSNCNRQGCTIDLGTGRINLAQTVRNGVFGTIPSSNSRQEFLMSYRINDKSLEALNSIDIKIYYFETMNDVSQEVYDIISSRQGTILGSSSDLIRHLTQRTANGIAVTGLGAARPAKPRPPCIFIIGR
ncbi:MAG: hypothetical protein Q8938_02460 [Bacteroidota bacterium]|nr:hypothetical protein [Bacteroidota bacterium]